MIIKAQRAKSQHDSKIRVSSPLATASLVSSETPDAFQRKRRSAIDIKYSKAFYVYRETARKKFRGTLVIDGGGAAGKTAIGGQLARELKVPFLDTGVLYRASVLFAMLRLQRCRGEQLGARLRTLIRSTTLQPVTHESLAKSLAAILRNRSLRQPFNRDDLLEIKGFARAVIKKTVTSDKFVKQLEEIEAQVRASHQAYYARWFVAQIQLALPHKDVVVKDWGAQYQEIGQVSGQGSIKQRQFRKLKRLFHGRSLADLQIEIIQETHPSREQFKLHPRGKRKIVNRLLMDGIDITPVLGLAELEAQVGRFAKSRFLREQCTKRARLFEKFAEDAGFVGRVLVGRDLQTEVFPKARYKFYLEGSSFDAALWRAADRRAEGQNDIDVQATQKALDRRLALDVNRKYGALRKAIDARGILNDGTRTTRGVTAQLLGYIAGKVG